jgi:hypothetical protein
MPYVEKSGLTITKEIHNCKTDCCPDRGKPLYTIQISDRKIALSEPEFQEIFGKFFPDCNACERPTKEQCDECADANFDGG